MVSIKAKTITWRVSLRIFRLIRFVDRTNRNVKSALQSELILRTRLAISRAIGVSADEIGLD
jgi:hypothetical protein